MSSVCSNTTAEISSGPYWAHGLPDKGVLREERRTGSSDNVTESRALWVLPVRHVRCTDVAKGQGAQRPV